MSHLGSFVALLYIHLPDRAVVNFGSATGEELRKLCPIPLVAATARCVLSSVVNPGEGGKELFFRRRVSLAVESIQH